MFKPVNLLLVLLICSKTYGQDVFSESVIYSDYEYSDEDSMSEQDDSSEISDPLDANNTSIDSMESGESNLDSLEDFYDADNDTVSLLYNDTYDDSLGWQKSNETEDNSAELFDHSGETVEDYQDELGSGDYSNSSENMTAMDDSVTEIEESSDTEADDIIKEGFHGESSEDDPVTNDYSEVQTGSGNDIEEPEVSTVQSEPGSGMEPNADIGSGEDTGSGLDDEQGSSMLIYEGSTSEEEAFEESNITEEELFAEEADVTVLTEEDDMECTSTEYGCCPDSDLPAHGVQGEGCCLNAEHGCCPDNIRPAEGPDGEGCGCESSVHGCCPDGNTPMRGEGSEGCGCGASEFGCCKDQHTPASGENYEGCPCHTFDYGCCEDGITVAEGPNKEGCQGCQASEFGCCPDGFTPASGEEMTGCGCAGSKFGCCSDGETPATGPEFEGCDPKPGEACFLKQEKGKCEDFSVQWYFDAKEGRCSRFWYGGCEGNRNRFDSSDLCERTCVNPPGSGRCYLPKVVGICTGDYERYYFDPTYKQCMKFSYGGCLGNANQFETKLECEQACIKADHLAVCEQQLEPGPCMGNYTRWYYDDQTGECDVFTYGGCHGNQNRFINKQECENSCMHKKLTLDTASLCKQPVQPGNCNETHARWGFHPKLRRCQPFYYSGCDGNMNNFRSVEECEQACPTAFPPELEVITKILNVEEGTDTVLEIAVEGNPFPSLSWQHNTNPVDIEGRYTLREDRSLVIESTSLSDAGSWMAVANNGLGKVARKQISLTVYPSTIPIQVSIPLENSTFETGKTIRLECKVTGFPIPTLEWFKNNARLPRSRRIYVEEQKYLVINHASPIDGGAYICRASNENMQNQAVVDITVLQGKDPIECNDHPQFANCKLIVRARYCDKNERLAKLCCKSCVESGQIAGPPA